MSDCKWPQGTCACYAQEAVKPDYAGRVWMHCEEGLNLSKSSMMRFVMFCLTNGVEIGTLHPFNRAFPRSQVSASVRIHPDLFGAFEKETGGKLRKPPRISLNTSSPEVLTGSATVKDYLTTEDEKQSHEWKCPIDYPGCRKNCGSYGCGN